MGFWSKVGKFAGKTALGIIAPGALAGYEYQKAKETNEMLKGFDEAIEPLFRSLAALKDGDDSWSELLVRLPLPMPPGVSQRLTELVSTEKAQSRSNSTQRHLPSVLGLR